MFPRPPQKSRVPRFYPKRLSDTVNGKDSGVGANLTPFGVGANVTPGVGANVTPTIFCTLFPSLIFLLGTKCPTQLVFPRTSLHLGLRIMVLKIFPSAIYGVSGLNIYLYLVYPKFS